MIVYKVKRIILHILIRFTNISIITDSNIIVLNEKMLSKPALNFCF